MKDCFKRFLLPSLALLFFASAFFGSCTDVDNQLGLGLLPDDQDMVFSQATLDGIKTYVATSGSLPINQLNLMSLGKYTVDGLGTITTGAAIQFVPWSFRYGDEFYGYKPKFDSITITLPVVKYYGENNPIGDDSLRFYIYELTKSLPPLYEKVDEEERENDTDTIRLAVLYEFDASDYYNVDKPLFSFDMKGEGTGTVTKTLRVEPAGEELIKKLFGYGVNEVGKEDYEIYKENNFDSKFRETFPGLYIAPSTEPGYTPEAMYTISPISGYESYVRYDYTFLTMYYQNYYSPGEEIPDGDDKPDQDDDTGDYIKHTSAYTIYSFDDTNIGSPNVNILAIDRNYDPLLLNKLIDPEKFEETSPGKEQQTVYIQGLHGVAGYLDFGGDFLTQLKALQYYEGEERILNINRARLYMWLEDDTNENMDNAPTRLGMYYKYKGFLPENIPDYYYYAEQTQQNLKAPYGGYINRAQGYYEMDITMYLRDLLTDEDTPKQIWLGPGHTTEVFYTPNYVAIQNPESGDQRMQLKLTYTLLKKTIKD